MKQGTITFRNNTQKALWDNEITGQLSDGNWENSKPYDHWKFWCNLESKVGRPGVESAPGSRPLRLNYALASPSLLEIIGDRMISIAKMSKVTTDHIKIQAGEYLEGIDSVEKFEKAKTDSDYKGKYLAPITTEDFLAYQQIPYTRTNLIADLKDMSNTMKLVGSRNTGSEFEDKDEKRIEDIITRAGGNKAKEIQLAQLMANKIGDGGKALRRARAAENQNYNNIAQIFFDKARQLGFTESKLKKPLIPEFNLVQSIIKEALEEDTLNELSPKSYQSIQVAGHQRGDQKGRNLADTATGLLAREFVNKPWGIKKIGSSDPIYTKIQTVKKQDVIWVCTPQENYKVLVSTTGNHHKPVVRDSSGNSYEVNRATANLISKMFEIYEGQVVPPNQLAQF